MFEEFAKGGHKRETRRLGASMAVSVILYSAIGGGVVVASAAARKAQQEDDLLQIELALPQEIEPSAPPAPPPAVIEPPAPVEPSPAPRPKPKAEPAPPAEIPAARPAESDAPLAPSSGSASGSASTGAQVLAPGPAPAVVEAPVPQPKPRPAADGPVQLPENASPALPLAGNAPPEYPEEARKSGVHGDVVAKLVVNANGTVRSVEILRGPEIFHASVKAALMRWRFEPARLPDGTAITTYKLLKLPFRLENM